MSIYGIGTDIVEVRRVAAILARHGHRFARHILAPRELPEYEASKFQERFLAKRFAAKEAFAKAMGTGFRGAVTPGNICVTHDQLGKPGFAFEAALHELVTRERVGPCHLSVSDEKELVTAFVVLERA
jgi:holo-[acyl-carrier protein] synthase